MKLFNLVFLECKATMYRNELQVDPVCQAVKLECKMIGQAAIKVFNVTEYVSVDYKEKLIIKQDYMALERVESGTRLFFY